MVSYPTTQSTESDSTDPETTDEPDSAESDVDGPGSTGPLARIAEKAAAVADVLSPFTSLLTAVVQAVTVWQLIKQV